MSILLAALTLAPMAYGPHPAIQAGQAGGTPPQKPGQTPPSQTPPAQTPPAQTPPGQTPPAQTPVTGTQGVPTPTTNVSIYSFTVQDLNGNNVSLAAYQGKALIIVNTGSYGIYNNQLRDLSNLNASDGSRIAVIGFPSNDFSHEPEATNALVAQRYQSLGVTFPIYGLTHVTGPTMSPLYQFLVSHGPHPNVPIQGDFVKFVTDHQGRIIARLGPNDGPLSLNFQLAIQNVR